MRKIILFSTLVLLIPVFFLVRYLTPEEGPITDWRIKGGGGGFVELKPPYNHWGGAGSLTIERSVSAIAEQAGYSYWQKKSRENTEPLWQKMIQPEIENRPWREALDEMLTPHGLTYFVDGHSIVLTRIEDADEKGKAMDVVAEAVSRFVSAETEPKRLEDPVIVFPLTGHDGKTTVLGTLLSELGMLKATYVPEKVIDLHFPSILSPSPRDLYHNPTVYLLGKPITPADRERVKAGLLAAGSASGTLEIDDDNSFSVVLNFEGKHGDRKFSRDGTEEELVTIPNWIARCIHEYCGMEISPEQRSYAAMPEVRDTSALFELVDMETGFIGGKVEPNGWKRLLMLNPDSIFSLYRYSFIRPDKNEDVRRCIEAARKRHGAHGLLEYREAYRLYRTGDYAASAPLFLELLEIDSRNDAIYTLLSDGLMELEMSESAIALLNYFEENNRDSYLPPLAKGQFYAEYGWRARGSSWRYKVSEEGQRKFRTRFHLAEQSLTRSWGLNPADPRAATELITVAKALGYDRAEMEKWFQKAIDADPRYFPAYRDKLAYIMPKWYGTREEMFAFARECAADPPDQSYVGQLILNAHREMYYRSGEGKMQRAKYYHQPEVWQEMKNAYENFLAQYPDSSWHRNRYARYASWANDYEEAARQLDIIGDNIDELYWSKKVGFMSLQSKVYSKTRPGWKRPGWAPKRKKKSADKQAQTAAVSSE